MPMPETIAAIDPTTLIVIGGFVVLLWLHVAFFNRVQRWQTPWNRWAKVRPNMHPILKVLAIGFSSVASLCYVLMLIAAAIG